MRIITRYQKRIIAASYFGSIDNCLSNPSKIIDIPNGWSSLGDCWCYRLLICLIDHSELCELIIDDLCLDILRALCIDFRKEENQRPEFTRTIRLLLNSMNISYLWDRVYSLLVEVCEERQKSPADNSSIEENNEEANGFHVKNVGSSSTNILELCAAFDFMMECFPLEHYVEIINLLNLMIDYCDILRVNEYLSLTRVVANILHRHELDKGPTLSSLIEKFQFLFHNFVTRRLLIITDTDGVYDEFGRLLERKYLNQTGGATTVAPTGVNLNMVAVYEAFCKVLSLISAIPILEEANEVVLGSTDRIQDESSFNYTSCTPYVQDLMLLSYKVENIKVNYASINLLLEMLSASQLSLDTDFALSNQLVESVAPTFSEEINASVVGEGSLLCDGSPSDGASPKTSRRLLLSVDEFSFIVKRTCWFPLAMKILWQYLSTHQTMWHDTVNLIQNMHNLTHQTLVCEDIICASLNSTDEQVAYDARRRFMLLFFLMKNDRSDLNLKQREFERPLFFMLDSLANKMDPFNCIAKDWLNQVYKFKATSRVLEPILKILLHVDTARSSIVYSKINISNIHHARIWTLYLYY